MTDISADISCDVTCSTDSSETASCGCAATRKSHRAKITKYGAGFIALCAACCVVPSVLVALGIIGLATGSYLSVGLGAALAVLVTLTGGFLLMKYLRTKR